MCGEKMKILVLGGAGYLGSILIAKLLSNAHKVICMDNLMYNQPSLLQYCNNSNFEFVWEDVRNINTVNKYIEQCDFFIPLASIVGAPACSRDPSSSSVDLAITKYSLKGKPIIFPMSNSGYGCKSGEIFCTEESPLEPISAYGKQKVRVENWLLENHTNTITLRLATVFGVSSRMRLDLLVNYSVNEAVTKRVLAVPEDIKYNCRNYVHIQDVADCFLFCINNFDKMKRNAYNLGNDQENTTVWELSQQISEITGCELLVSHHYQDQDKRNYIVSNEKLRQAGFEAKRSITEEIPNLVNVCKMIKMMNYGRTEYKNA
jgi:nucleoside-diphosphate-sugar epimerase